jgi:hypothetical protein
MFDFRYHALSLSAVIVALVLGVLLGVAIGDRGLVSSGEKGIRADLRHSIASAQHHADELQAELNERNDVLGKVYPLLVDGRLTGRNLGVVYLGAKSSTDKSLINAAITPQGGSTGANLAWLLAVHEPLNASAIADHAQGTQYAQLAADPTLYEKFGFRIGSQLVAGGQLIKREQSTLSDSFDGKLMPVQSIVLVHDPPTGLSPAETEAVDAFEQGVVKGMTEAGGTVVGVQTTSTTPSQSAWFHNQGLTYVSNLDQVEGRISLIYGLTGYTGAFGRGSGEQLLPDVPSGG